MLTGDNEAEGPGGGSGPGYIAVTGTPSITMSLTGGANGTTTSDGLTEFPPNGATLSSIDVSTLKNGIYFLKVKSKMKKLPINY